MSRWEDTVIIDNKIQDIIKERGTQNVAMMDTLGHKTQPRGARPKQGGGDNMKNEVRQEDIIEPSHLANKNTNMRAASAPSILPLTPTPYRMEGEMDFRTKNELEHQTKMDKTYEYFPIKMSITWTTRI